MYADIGIHKHMHNYVTHSLSMQLSYIYVQVEMERERERNQISGFSRTRSTMEPTGEVVDGSHFDFARALTASRNGKEVSKRSGFASRSGKI